MTTDQWINLIGVLGLGVIVGGVVFRGFRRQGQPHAVAAGILAGVLAASILGLLKLFVL